MMDSMDESIPANGCCNASLSNTNVEMSQLNNEMSHIEDAAEGTFGVVKLGTLDVDGQEYAVKVSKYPLDGENDLQRRLQEVYALSACQHPHILRYFDSWVEEHTVLMRTEWLGENVSTMPTPLPEELLLRLLQHISSALHYLHSHQLLHRDVKPDNILARQLVMDESGATQFWFKLCDFGLSRPMPAHPQSRWSTGEVFRGLCDEDGDQKYLCPEALACEGTRIDGGADVYALGATCVVLMGGSADLVRQGYFGPHFSSYSPALQKLVQRMLSTQPKNRPTAFDVVMSTLPDVICASEAVQRRLRIIQDLRTRLGNTHANSAN